jgi:hypothetical protein
MGLMKELYIQKENCINCKFDKVCLKTIEELNACYNMDEIEFFMVV